VAAGNGKSNRWRGRALKLVLAGLITLVMYWCVMEAPLPFNDTWWHAGEKKWNDPYHRRNRIADWLVFWNSLVGRSRADVVVLLGKPPPTAYFKEWDMVYPLGREREFIAIDSEWLVLRLNARGVVEMAEIVRD